MMRNFFDERGDAMTKFVIAALVVSLVAVFLTSGLTKGVAFGIEQSTRDTSELAQTRLLEQTLPAEADSATSVFIPSHDIFGQPNAVVNVPTAGGVIGEPVAGAHEIDFFQRGYGILGALGVFDKFWAYYYNANTNQIVRYDYASRNAACLATGVSLPGTTWSNIKKMTAGYLPASQLPLVDKYLSSTGATPQDVTLQSGFCEAIEGNKGVVVWVDGTPANSPVTNPKWLQYAYLLPSSAPGSVNVNFTWQPPASGPLLAAPNIVFNYNSSSGGWLPGVPSSTITVQETNYHRGFSRTPCVQGATTIATVSGPVNQLLGADSAANNPPATFPGEWEQYNVTPVSSGACTVTFQSLTTGPFADNKSASVTITVAATPPPALPFNSWPQQLVVGSGGASVGTTSGTVVASAASRDPMVAFGPVLNALLGGGVARAAGGAPCFALGQTLGGGVDNSLPPQVSAQLGMYVDSNGCEVDANGNPLPAASVAMIAYETVGSGQSGTFSVPASNGCGPYASFGSWTPNLGRNDAQAALPTAGVNAGTCSVTLTDGISSQTPAPDKGSVEVSIIQTDPCAAPGYCILFVGYNQITADAVDGTLCRGGWAIGEQIFSATTGQQVPANNLAQAFQWVDYSGNPIAPLAPLDNGVDLAFNGNYPNPLTLPGTPSAAYNAAYNTADAVFSNNLNQDTSQAVSAGGSCTWNPGISWALPVQSVLPTNPNAAINDLDMPAYFH
jgi:hypothetical protein